MDYSKQTWNDDPGGGTAITAARLNYMETGIEAAAEGRLDINAQTGTSYTLLASDSGKLITLSNTGAITVTVPSGTFSVGQRVDLLALNTGMVTVVAGSGTTVNGTPSLVSRAQYSAMSVICIASNTFVVVGDLA